MRIWTQTLHMNAITHFELLKGGFVVFEEMQPWDSLCLCPTASAAALPAAPLWILAPGRKALLCKESIWSRYSLQKCNRASGVERSPAGSCSCAVTQHCSFGRFGSTFLMLPGPAAPKSQAAGPGTILELFFFFAFFFKQRPAVF